jgi:phosphatidylethanolamine/phosphatidyl-N-methylethanolamine N-methyltransferase
MKPDPDHVWTSEYTQKYENNIYGPGLQGYVMRKSHDLIEADFDEATHFAKVLEVGAGTGNHFQSIRHSFDEYLMTDLHVDMLRQKHGLTPGVVTKVEDATQLSFEDETFDRVIASHVLEHLYKPHLVLREWHRVLKPGGVLSVVLPCDPGLMWRFGRTLGPRKRGSQFSVDYDCVMALEHVNSITSLKALIDYYFETRIERWWPLRFASTDLNLIYTVNIYK